MKDVMNLFFFMTMVFLLFTPAVLAMEAKQEPERPQSARELYEEAFNLLDDFPADKKREIGDIIKKGWINVDNQIEIYIAKDRGIIALVRCAAAAEGPAVTHSKSLTDSRTDEIKKAKRLAMYLVLKGRFFESRDKLPQAIDCYLLVKRLAFQVADGGSIFGHAVALGLERLANRALVGIKQYPAGLSSRTLKNLIELEAERPRLYKAIEMEHRIADNTAFEIFDNAYKTGKIEGMPEEIYKLAREKGLLDARRWANRFRVLSMQVFGPMEYAAKGPYAWVDKLDIEKTLENLRADEKSLKKDMDEFAVKFPASMSKVTDNESALEWFDEIHAFLGDFASRNLLVSIMPNISGIAGIGCENIFATRALICRLGIKAYRKKHKKYPDKLEDLAPGTLPYLPIDPFDGKIIRYRKTDEGYLLYSVGPDLKDSKGERAVKGRYGEGDIIYKWK